MSIQDVKVLIIDDVRTVQLHLKELLRGEGIAQIQTLSSAEEAKILLTKEKFDLILCDWHMAPVNGFDFLRYVKSDAKLKDVAFIMVTAEATKEQVIQAVDNGVDSYVLKPLTMKMVKDRIMPVLRKKGLVL